MNLTPLNTAQLEWTTEGYPFNTQYQDKYFYRSGIEESKAVFLEGNQLHKKWQSWQLPQHNILETGFGTGLNFLLTLELWQNALDEGLLQNTLCQYFSVEKTPITAADLKKIHQIWPGLSTLSKQLLAQMPQPIPGRHQLKFYYKKQCFFLYLLYAEINSALNDLISEQTVEIHSFYLDGFSPAKNISMWSQQNFKQLAQLSASTATLATFTAASAVNCALNNAGFDVIKINGFDKKREMITACFNFENLGRLKTKPKAKANPNPNPNKNNIYLVVGAGLAGCITATKLAHTGAEVDLVDSAPQICNGASGNAAGLAYPRLANDYDGSCLIQLAGHSFLLAEIENLNGLDVDFSGLDFLIGEKNPNSRININTISKLKIKDDYISNNKASILFEKALDFKTCGWIKPQSLAQAYLDSVLDCNKLSLFLNSRIISLVKQKNHWQLSGIKKLSEKKYDAVVICCGNKTSFLLPQYDFCTNPVRGQIDCFQSKTTKPVLFRPLCAQGYIIPQKNNQYWVGASYQIDNQNLKPNPLDSEHHRLMLCQLTEVSSDKLNLIDSRVGVRLSSKDRLPLVGAVAEEKQYGSWYRQKIKRKSTVIKEPLTAGLYVNIAHGSHGLITIPLLSEHLVSQLTGRVSPIAQYLHQYINPQRFLQRKIKRENSIT